MRLWLLSHLEGSPGNALVLDAARAAGHEVQLVRPQALRLALGPEGVTVEGPGPLPELVFTRMGSSAPPAGFDALRHLEAAGVRCVNASAALELARDKLRTFQALAKAGLPLPATVVLGDGPLEPQLAPLGPPPWILKLPVGTQGLGVAQVDSLPSLRSVLDVLRGLGERVLVQRYIRESAGADVRVLVVGGTARAAMRRQAQAGELRSNLHRGGSAVQVELTDELRDVAQRSAAALALEVAGVDMLPADEGYLVCEVNGSPGLEGLNAAVGRDLAVDVVAFLQGLG